MGEEIIRGKTANEEERCEEERGKSKWKGDSEMRETLIARRTMEEPKRDEGTEEGGEGKGEREGADDEMKGSVEGEGKERVFVLSRDEKVSRLDGAAEEEAANDFDPTSGRKKERAEGRVELERKVDDKRREDNGDEENERKADDQREEARREEWSERKVDDNIEVDKAEEERSERKVDDERADDKGEKKSERTVND